MLPLSKQNPHQPHNILSTHSHYANSKWTKKPTHNEVRCKTFEQTKDSVIVQLRELCKMIVGRDDIIHDANPKFESLRVKEKQKQKQTNTITKELNH